MESKAGNGKGAVLDFENPALKAPAPPRASRIDQLLEDLASGGDQDRIFEEIYTLYGNSVLLFFRRRNFSPEDSHDLRQEAFLNLFRGIRSFAGQSSFETWLFGIAANVWRNHLRFQSTLRRQVQEISLSDRDGQAAANEIPTLREQDQEKQLAGKELASLLSRAIEDLPPKMRQCALLRFQQGLKYQEIAQLTGTSTATAKAHVHQARQKLRERLAGVWGSLSPI